MVQKELNISFEEYSSMEELNPQDKELCLKAIEAIKGSYAPYSNFLVGAAVRLSNGEIVTGANQENAAYPSGICAERTAMFAASANHPQEAMVSLAVAGGLNGQPCEVPATPCGACRQVMAQYQRKGGQPMSVLLIGAERVWKFSKVDDILPFIFDSI